MPTKYKWLPSEPTDEMTKAWCANCHAWDLDAYKAMWQAAPDVEQTCDAGDFCIKCPDSREPLSEEEIKDLIGELPYGDYNFYRAFVREIEQAHGIGTPHEPA